MTKARLRVVPAIAHEPEEGSRLRRDSEVRAATLPHRPWSSEICALQMKSKIALMLLEAVLKDMGDASDLLDISLRHHIRIEELAHQLHAVEEAAAALQPN